MVIESKQIKKIGYWFISGLLIVTAVIFAVSIFNLPGGYKLMAVTSGSMEPSINVGSIVLVAKASEYNSGDVITYASEANKKETITHRVIHSYYPDKSEKPVYLTKGDANENLDQGIVKDEQIVGKVYFTIPYLGYASTILKKPYGFIAFVVIPATIIVYEEFKTLRKELFAYLKTTRFFKRKPGRKRKKEPETFEINLKSKYFIAVPVIAAAIAVSAASHSFFFDSEASTNNTFVAGVWITPTPTATPTPTPHIVINEVFPEGQAKGEWVEIYNSGSAPVDVSGWKISDRNAYDTGQDDVFPTVSPIPAGGYALVITNQSTVTGIPSSVTSIALTNANIGSGLNDDGDAVFLKNSSNVVVDAVSYGNETTLFSSPPPAPDRGESLARSPNGQDTDSSNDWVIDTSPSIGGQN